MTIFCSSAQVAQSVEQRTENPRVDGSIPPLGTMNSKGSDLIGAFFMPITLIQWVKRFFRLPDTLYREY